jgi:N-acetylglucosaminyl-diphospho-decaprenol L-rhamnosyltransferase
VQVATVEPRVDVVVVAFNSGAELRECVEPLSREPSINVVVVDNASTDGGVAAVQDLPVTVVPLDENIGFGGGCNVGWRAAAAPYVLFLNPDARLPPEAVLCLADVLERTSAGAVGPRIVDPSGSLEWSIRRFPEVRSIYGQAIFAHRLFPSADWVDEPVRDPERYEREGPCDWASGACLLVRREMLEQLGGFDEGFFMYCEDVDLCRRVWDRGSAVVYTPTVVCTHAGGASSPRWRLMRVLVRSRIRYAQKHFGRGRAIAYRSGVVLNELTHVLIGRGFRGRLGHARALVDAIGKASPDAPRAKAGRSSQF